MSIRIKIEIGNFRVSEEGQLDGEVVFSRSAELSELDMGLDKETKLALHRMLEALLNRMSAEIKINKPPNVL